ncbi:MAG: hypothetical protein ACYCOO_03080 [Chitinophagaceae bacterium]
MQTQWLLGEIIRLPPVHLRLAITRNALSYFHPGPEINLPVLQDRGNIYPWVDQPFQILGRPVGSPSRALEREERWGQLGAVPYWK